MVMQSLRSGASGGLLKYVLFGILGMALGGLVVMDVRGVLQGGSVGGQDVAKIEGEPLHIRDFDRALRRNIADYGITVQQAAQIGLLNDVLTNEIRVRLLEHEAHELGIDIGDEEVAKRIATYIKPYAQEGEKLQDTLNRRLYEERMDESEYVAGIKREVSAEILMNAVRDGYNPEKSLIASEMYKFQKQTRDVDLIIFENKSVNIMDDTTEEELKAFYDATKYNHYSIPEYRHVEIALLHPDDLKIEAVVDEAELREMYNSAPDQFMQGEQLVLSQAMVQSEEQANQIYGLVQEGTSLEDAVQNVTGSTSSFFANKPFETQYTMKELVEAVSEREVGKTYPPVRTTLGFHVARLEGVVAPSVRPFDVIKDQLSKDLKQAKEEEEIFQVIETLEKSIDDGSSFEEIKKNIPIKLYTIEAVNNLGKSKDDKSVLEQFSESIRPDILEFILEAEEDQVPFLHELNDGSFVAVRLIGVEAEGFETFDSVRKDVEQKFVADRQKSENEMTTRKLFAELQSGGTTFDAIATEHKKSVQTIKSIGIEGEPPTPLNSSVVPIIFQTSYNGYAFTPLENGYGIMKISGYDIPEEQADEAVLSQIQTRLENEAKDEAFLMYLRMLNEKYDARINETLIERYYGSASPQR